MLNFYFIFTTFKGKLKISDGKIGLSEWVGYFKDFTVSGKTAYLWKSWPGKAVKIYELRQWLVSSAIGGLESSEDRSTFGKILTRKITDCRFMN